MKFVCYDIIHLCVELVGISYLIMAPEVFTRKNTAEIFKGLIVSLIAIDEVKCFYGIN